MTATVGIFFHSGLTTAPVDASGGRFSSDSVMLLKQPYLGRSFVSVDQNAAVSCSQAPQNTKLVRIEVQPGKAVRYEINPPNRGVVADSQSPLMSGSDQLQFGDRWTISFLEEVIS